MLVSGTPGKPEAESDKMMGSVGGHIAHSAIVGQPEASGAGCTPVSRPQWAFPVSHADGLTKPYVWCIFSQVVFG